MLTGKIAGIFIYNNGNPPLQKNIIFIICDQTFIFQLFNIPLIG